MENVKTVFVQRVEKPARKVILKRGVKARDYFAYCEEVGCDVWGTLTSMKSLCGEPVCLWLPPEQRAWVRPNMYRVWRPQRIMICPVPEGFDVIRLPAAEYLMFQGEPFAEEDYCEAIGQVRGAIEKYDPPVWAMCGRREPTHTIEPVGDRGYIELLPVRLRRALSHTGKIESAFDKMSNALFSCSAQAHLNRWMSPLWLSCTRTVAMMGRPNSPTKPNR